MAIKLIDSTSVWCNNDTSDKVYNIQLIQTDGDKYQVDTQYGKREAVIAGKWLGRSFKSSDGKDAVGADAFLSEWTAKNLYNTLLRKKVAKGYDQRLPKAIMPSEYAGGSTVFVTKDELAKVAENVKGLLDFLSTKGVEQTEAIDPMVAMIESMR